MKQRRPREHDEAHLRFIRQLPCCVCLDNTATEAAHIRMADARAAKPMVGLGEKPDDKFVTPLCSKCHRDQHLCGERDWWPLWDIDPVFLALALHAVSGDHAAGIEIIEAYH
jgi:hypothetical protein